MMCWTKNACEVDTYTLSHTPDSRVHTNVGAVANERENFPFDVIDVNGIKWKVHV